MTLRSALSASQCPRIGSTNGAIHVALHATPLRLRLATCIPSLVPQTLLLAYLYPLMHAFTPVSPHHNPSGRPASILATQPPSLLTSSWATKSGGVAASKGARKSLVSRTLERCRSGLGGGGKVSAGTAPGCFSVYVGPERERFVVRADRANHPLFRSLLDDAEREYGYGAQGPLALPCAVDAFLDVLWHMDNDHHDDGCGDAVAPSASPICGIQRGGSKGRLSGYRVLSPAKSSPASFFFTPKASPARVSTKR